MRVLYFGSYNPNYSRNHVLINGLRQNGVEVLECHDNSSGILKFIRLYKKHRLLRNNYDVMVVGFLGQQMVPFARFLTRKPIIFDAFLSLYDSNVFDRKTTNSGSLRAQYYWFLDWISMRLADKVLFDTQEHINYAVNEFGIAKDKFVRIFVGTDDKIFYPADRAENSQFTVHFHGSFIPLQGVDCIIKAAKLLESENINFNILGSGQTYSENRKLASQLNVKNINFINRVDYDKLPEYINKGDICLGIFGRTAKTRRVIPNKIYEYAAMAKPMITLDTSAVRELFDQDDMILIGSADPKLLAEAIIGLKNNTERRIQLGRNAGRKFISFATPALLGRQLKDVISNQLRK